MEMQLNTSTYTVWARMKFAYVCYCLRVNEAELALAREDIGRLLFSFPPDNRTNALSTASEASCKGIPVDKIIAILRCFS